MVPRQWLMIRASSPSEELAALLTEGLIASGGTAVQEDGLHLTTWVRDRSDPEAFVDTLRNRLSALAGRPVRVTWDRRAEEDWTAKWREGLGPRRVGRRIVIHPSWSRPDLDDDDIAVVIDPQMAFGTGEHASTRGALRLLEDAVRPGSRVLDVGTGSAVLAIAAAGLGASHVEAVDIDADAVSNARENVNRNGCTDRVHVRHANVDSAFLERADPPFDVIVANVLSGVLRSLMPAFRPALVDGGSLILSGVLADEAGEMGQAAAEAGLTLVVVDSEQEWWSARFTH